MQLAGTACDILYDTATIAGVSLPIASIIAALVGLTGWGIWGTEEGLLAFGITWCAAMVIAQITMRKLIQIARH